MPASTDRAPASFEAFGLHPALLSALAALGYEEPTPIQGAALPPLLAGRDLLGRAATGTGKTAAFALPLLQRLAATRSGTSAPRALVLVPTRELAMQVSEALHRYGRGLELQVLPIYGGQPIGRQLGALKRGVDIVVATPGRALDHIRRGTLALDHMAVVVLDEADEMLDMGFIEDIDAILADTPETRQTVLFSATMPARIAALAKRHLREPVRVEIERERVQPTEAPRVRQTAYVVTRPQKLAALIRVLDVESPGASIVFCRTRNEVDEVTDALNGRGYRADALHGGMAQDQRDRAMGRLRAGIADLLVATDVAARGLDIEQLTHVVNYDVPSAPDAYVHRIGRVGRAGREGVAITLAEPREHRMLRNIERATGQRIPVARVPTVADLRARRLELTRASLRELILNDELDQVRVVVESLADEFDVMTVALAATALAHQSAAGTAEEEAEIRDAPLPGAERRGRDAATRGRRETGGPARGPRRGREGGSARIFIGVGRRAGIRPQDLVGAIANEAGLRGGEIGAIEISENGSVVEVPEALAGDVIAALRATTIRGKRPTVRRET